jgi:hypothetical protein
MSQTKTSKSNRLSHALAMCVLGVLAVLALSPNVCAADAEVFSVKLPEPVVKTGATESSVVQILSVSGWKWNKEYPSKVSFSSEGPITVSPEQLTKANGKIQVEDGNASLPFTVTGKSAGEATVLMKASFSICSEETCKVFRNKEFRFTVKVQ